MVLPREYLTQRCSMARALEVVGERWSLLVVRDAFFGVRRFSDFARHLRIPRAVLTDRLGLLVAEGVLTRVPGSGRRLEYTLTDKGLALWPVVRSLTEWGDAHYAPQGPRRIFTHAACGGGIDAGGGCRRCAKPVPVSQTVMTPGPGFEQPGPDVDPVSAALGRPHHLLDPVPA